MSNFSWTSLARLLLNRRTLEMGSDRRIWLGTDSSGEKCVHRVQFHMIVTFWRRRSLYTSKDMEWMTRKETRSGAPSIRQLWNNLSFTRGLLHKMNCQFLHLIPSRNVSLISTRPSFFSETPYYLAISHRHQQEMFTRLAMWPHHTSQNSLKGKTGFLPTSLLACLTQLCGRYWTRKPVSEHAQMTGIIQSPWQDSRLTLVVECDRVSGW